MANDIEIGVTTITNNIEITSQPTDQIIDINVTDNTDEVTINVTPSVIEININKGGLNSNLVTSVNTHIGDVILTKSDLGLGNVDNTGDYYKPLSFDTQAALNTKADLISGLVPAYQLPSYVDDIIEVVNYASLPTVGEIGKIYIELDNNKMFRWSGSIYIEVAANNATWGAITGTLSNQTDLNNALNARVPYTGAISDVNLGAYGVTLDFSQYNISNTQANAVGKLKWNDIDGTLDLGLKGGNVTLQLGQEQVVRVVNKTGSNLTEAGYQAVYTSGAQGQRLKVDLALANYDLTSAGTLGIVTENILVNQEGFVTTNGLVRGINTTGSLQSETWIDGDILYLSPTTAGRVTNIKPIAPQHLVIIGVCVHAHATQGTIFVKVDNGYELDELHNVLVSSLSNNDLLVYETSSTLWKNKSISTILGYTPAPVSGSANYIQNQNTSAQSANMWISGTGTFEGALIANGINSNVLYTGRSFEMGRGWIGFRSGTDHSFNIDTYNDGTFKNAFNLTQSGEATFASSVTATNGTLIGTTDIGAYAIKNQNASAQSANMWISGNGTFSSLNINANIGTYIPLKVFGNLNTGGKDYASILVGKSEASNQSVQFGWVYDNTTPTNSFAHITPNGSSEGSIFKLTALGAATFASSVSVNGNSVINGVAGGDVLTLNKSTGASLALSGATGTTNNVLLVGTNSTNPDLQIYTGGSERMRITSSGDLGIGTTNPLSKFVVSNNGIQGLEFTPNFYSTANRILSYNRGTSVYNSLVFDGLDYIFQNSSTEVMSLSSVGTLKINNLAGTGKRTVVADASGNLSTTVGYKVYTALLSQSGTNAPVATVLENTLGFTPTFSYVGVGTYDVNSSLMFDINKTTCQIQPLSIGHTGIYIASSSNLRINASNPSGIQLDNLFTIPTFFEIRIYN